MHESLQLLADSIATHGVLQPIIVRENSDFPGTYEIIAGERRWRASKIAGLAELPVVVVDGDDLKVAEISLNSQTDAIWKLVADKLLGVTPEEYKFELKTSDYTVAANDAGKYTDIIDELLIKLTKAKVKQIKIKEV